MLNSLLEQWHFYQASLPVWQRLVWFIGAILVLFLAVKTLLQVLSETNQHQDE